ncbi:hypothetical protein [Haladaptatus sp. CMSO5]|uniref:hypothetical protein n=1 Tax=Haladaptatus sp. CMSO5 TaxID=3120514 RepID=UPI002FCE57FB
MRIEIPEGGFSDEITERLVDAIIAGADERAVGVARKLVQKDRCDVCCDTTFDFTENDPLSTITHVEHIVSEAITLIGLAEHGTLDFDPDEYDWVCATIETTLIVEFFDRCPPPERCAVCTDERIEECGHWRSGSECPYRGEAP